MVSFSPVRMHMFEWMGVGIPERDASKRALATVVVLLMALICVLISVWMIYALPSWIAFLCGFIVLALGVNMSISVVGRIVGKKVKPPHDRFGDE